MIFTNSAGGSRLKPGRQTSESPEEAILGALTAVQERTRDRTPRSIIIYAERRSRETLIPSNSAPPPDSFCQLPATQAPSELKTAHPTRAPHTLDHSMVVGNWCSRRTGTPGATPARTGPPTCDQRSTHAGGGGPVRPGVGLHLPARREHQEIQRGPEHQPRNVGF